MKKRLVFLILTVLLLGMTTACTKKSSTDKPTNESNNVQVEDSFSESSEVAVDEGEKVLTLEDSELRFIYAKDNFVVVAFHGPDGDIGMNFCNPDGSNLEQEALLGYGDLGNGWTLGITYELSENYTADDLGVGVTDYDGEKMPDGTYVTKVFSDLGEPMTEDEMKDIGLSFLDGACGVVSGGRATYGSDNFGLFFSISWLDDNYDKGLDEVEGFSVDRFSFFAGDGTPLGEYFDGYTLQVDPLASSIYVLLYQEDAPEDEAKNESMCDELKNCQPYAVYTGADGSTQQFPLLQN